MKHYANVYRQMLHHSEGCWHASSGETKSLCAPWVHTPCNTLPMQGNVRIPASLYLSDLSPARWGPICSNKTLFWNAHFLESSDFSHVSWFSRQSLQLSAQRTFHDAISTVMQEGMCENMFLAYIQIRRSREPGRAQWRPWLKRKTSVFQAFHNEGPKKADWIPRFVLFFFNFPPN